MTIKFLKSLSKISTIFVAGAMLTLPFATASNAGQAGIMIVDGGHLLSICVLDGGDITVKNGVQTCTNPVTGTTTVCDGPAGSVDACWTERTTGGKFKKSTLSGGGTMSMPPNTNTTVGSGTKPKRGKLIMRNVIKN